MAEETGVQGTAIPSLRQDQNNITKPQETSVRLRKVVLGALVTFLLGIAAAGTAHLAKQSFRDEHFRSPFFLVYFANSWIILIFPIHFATRLFRTRGNDSAQHLWRESVPVYQNHNGIIRPTDVIVRCLVCCAIHATALYLYFRALTIISSLDATVLSATTPCFTYLFSWIMLRKKFMAIRIVAVILGTTGVVLMVYTHGFGHNYMWGSVMAIVAVSGWAFIKVLFIRWIGEVSNCQLSLFLSSVGLVNILAFWPVLLLLYFTGAEPMAWQSLPWIYLLGSAGSHFVCVILVNYGRCVTYHIFICLGLLLAIPLCAVAEVLWDILSFDGMQVGSMVLIIASFFIVVLPDHWFTIVTAIIKFNKHQDETPPRRNFDVVRSRSRANNGRVSIA